MRPAGRLDDGAGQTTVVVEAPEAGIGVGLHDAGISGKKCPGMNTASVQQL
jgi:hypothetical protein